MDTNFRILDLDVSFALYSKGVMETSGNRASLIILDTKLVRLTAQVIMRSIIVQRPLRECFVLD